LVLQEISKYLRNPHKPAILAMSRPDPKKNITTLVKAFGENKTLRGLANLVLIMVSCCTPSTLMCDKLFRAISVLDTVLFCSCWVCSPLVVASAAPGVLPCAAEKGFGSKSLAKQLQSQGLCCACLCTWIQ